METIGELNFDDMRDEDILKTVKYLQKNVNNFDIVAKQISGGDNYLEDAEKAKVILEELSDVIEAGSNCGISGFIYYADTSKFYKDNYRVIVDLVEDMAQEGGYKNSLDFLAQTEGASLDNIEDTCAKIFLEYVGFLRVSEDDTETISDYSQNLNEFSETLYSIKAISDYVDNYNEEKQNSNTRKHK